MNTTPVVAWMALIVSMLSLVVSVHNSRRDRARLRVTSTFNQSSFGDSASIKIELVNAGRRPIIISMLRSESLERAGFARRKIGKWSGEYLEHPTGLTLNEGQSHSIRLTADDLFFNSGEEVYSVDSMCITDTLGNRHEIEGMRKNIKRLQAWREGQKSQYSNIVIPH